MIETENSRVIAEADVRRYAGKFFDKNNFKPSPKMVADHFMISVEEAKVLINRNKKKKILGANTNGK